MAASIPLALLPTLAGCSSFFPENVTPSESAASPVPTACNQSDAKLRWQPKQEAQPALLGYRTITATAEGSESTADTPLGYEAEVTSDDFLSPGYFEKDWVDFLLDEYGRTGQTTTDSAASSANSDGFFDSATLNDPPVGVSIIGYQVGQVRVQFSLECRGEEVGSGWLTTTGGNLLTTLIYCGDEKVVAPGTENELYLNELHSYCPAS